MKKTLKKISLLTIAASMMFACSPFEPEIPDVEKPVPGEDPEEVISRDVTFSATTETMSEWAVGDKISIYDGKAVLAATNTVAGTIAKFPVTLSEGFTSFLAFYPENSNIGASEASYSIAGTQTGVAGSYEKTAMPFIAKGKTNKLYFRELGAKINFVLDMDDAASVKITANKGVKLTGAFDVDFTGENPVVTVGSSVSDCVEIAGPFTKGETYTAVVLPFATEGYTVLVKNAKGEEIAHHANSKAVSAGCGETVTLEGVKADADLPRVFKVTHMWLWGGTGPEYDCSKRWDMFEKAGVFDKTDGRGIEAIKDDYLELCNDGTFYNWAGVDARHWWMAFDKEQTPSKYKSLDMVNKYYVLPKNVGKWATSDGVNFTFTNEEGEETTATLVGPGTYELPGCSPAKSVTITTMALKFVLKNGVDDWDHSWDDYGVFYKHPRQLYIELEQMPAGFITPDESKTTDEVVFVEPDDPKPIFDITTLPGSYNVYGGNSSPYGLFVLGGSGDDPAFISPIDKSWDWDDSIWKESDNGLVVKCTELNGDIAKGTINYWCGADGGFWDYIWNKTGEDLSRFYGLLPHGEKSFELNLKTYEVTIDGSVKATLLTPGTHEFVYGRTLTIENGCIALDFHLMDPIAATGDRWNDVDRFVNAPLEYVMIFEKEN